MTYDKPVHVLGRLPDGRVFGADDDNQAYIGTVYEVDRSELTVDTVLAEDKESYERFLVYDNRVIARSTASKTTFEENRRPQPSDLEPYDDDKQAYVDAEWEKESTTTKLPSSIYKEPVINWTEI